MKTQQWKKWAAMFAGAAMLMATAIPGAKAASQTREAGGKLFLTPTITVSGRENADQAAWQSLTRFLTRSGFAVREARDDKSVEIHFVKPSADERLPREGYALEVTQSAEGRNVITLSGNDSAGSFYAVQTLKQMVRDGNNISIAKTRIVDAPKFSRRGVVEGFYGTPWTHRDRLNQLRFYGENKLNTYIYAPKDDIYHRAKWRVPYPDGEMRRMRELIEAAKENHVEFVFAVSPGIDIRFDGEAGEADFASLLEKLDSLYAMGVRSFAIYFDDIEDKSGAKQAALLNRVRREFVEKRDGVKPLLTVPTEYYTRDMVDGDGRIKPYTKDFSRTLDRGIDVMYTGPAVVSEGITAADLRAVGRIYDRKMAIWWNYPVTDYLQNKLALGPIYGLDGTLNTGADCFMMNPMEHAELSKITLRTGAQYAWNPKDYQPEAAFDQAVEALYGGLAEEMKVFARHSMRLDTDWAHTGMRDAPKLRAQMDALWNELNAGRDAADEIAALRQDFARMEAAYARLDANLPIDIRKECLPQLTLFGQLAAADQAALRMVEAKLQGDEASYVSLRGRVAADQAAAKAGWARVSEKTALAFLQEALDFTASRP